MSFLMDAAKTDDEKAGARMEAAEAIAILIECVCILDMIAAGEAIDDKERRAGELDFAISHGMQALDRLGEAAHGEKLKDVCERLIKRHAEQCRETKSRAERRRETIKKSTPLH